MGRAIAMLASGLLLAACGALESPDLGTGTLTGRLANASPAAYLYPLGRPDLTVFPGPDGRWVIEEVPVETEALVVVDAPDGAWRAELVPVDVDGGDERVVPELDAVTLPLAGRVAAVARLGGGCTSGAPRFTVAGTDQVDVAAASVGVAAVMEVLPAGPFELRARSDGFTDGREDIVVLSGQTAYYEVELEVESGGGTPGCLATGACRDGRLCSPDDGVCYECLEDADCALAGGESACVDRSCRQPAAPAELCDPCTKDAACQSGTCAVGGYCTRGCLGEGDPNCPAGMACQLDGLRSVCKPPQGCGELKEELGTECLTDAGCSEDLAGGVCLGVDTTFDPPAPGYCTGACTSVDDCSLVPGYTCGASGLCERTF